ncbi:MAG: polyphosphate polymerase domain-containing protein [Firmicutes bacterium]|nr:polyphosphate polymerase domain-containing protein [Bacillota bacterium]
MLETYRVEKKFIVDKITAEKTKHLLKLSMSPDTNNGIDGYEVRSLYFDSIYDDDFFDKKEGLENRKKIRLRTYGHSSEIIKLEVKEKRGESQLKRSLIINKEEAEKMIRGDYRFLLLKDSDLSKDIYLEMTQKLYRPKTLIEYKREAYIMKSNDVRITFDTKLTSSEANFDIFSEEIPMNQIYFETIMEVKYRDFLFEYIKKIIRGIDKKEVSVSKYVLGRRLGHR